MDIIKEQFKKNGKSLTEARTTIGKFLSTERIKNGISKYMIMKRAGINIQMINKIETGNSLYEIDTLLKYILNLNSLLKNESDQIEFKKVVGKAFSSLIGTPLF